MIGFLSWIWTRIELHPWWRAITLRRHQSELRALQTARAFPGRAGLPIGLTVMKWIFAAGLPAFVLGVAGIEMSGAASFPVRVAGGAVYVLSNLYAVVLLCLCIAWAFRWYRIADGLRCGSAALADRKEAELRAALRAAGVIPRS